MVYTVRAYVDGNDEGIPGVAVEALEVEAWELAEAVESTRKAITDFYEPTRIAAQVKVNETAAPGDNTVEAQYIDDEDEDDEYDPDACAGCPNEAQCAAEAGVAVGQTVQLDLVNQPLPGAFPVVLIDPSDPHAEPFFAFAIPTNTIGRA